MEYQTTINALIVSAIAAGVYHTLIGPDHYLPFVALGKARGWSYSKTVLATSLCGVGHVASSVVIGLAGIAIGSAVGVLEALEGARADIVKWLLLLFAVAYTAYGIRRALCPPCTSTPTERFIPIATAKADIRTPLKSPILPRFGSYL